MTLTAAELRDLHRIHCRRTDLLDRLRRGPLRIQATENLANQAQAERDAGKELLKRLRMNCDGKELQLGEREGRVEDTRGKLNACSSNREYQALIEQIAADEQATSVLSDEILELLDKISQQEKTVEKQEAKLAKAQQDRDAARKQVDEGRAGLEDELAQVTAELARAEDALTGDFKVNYKRMAKARGEDALAVLDGENCTGCYQRVTTQQINLLSLSRPVFCGGCGRLLYLPEGWSM